MNEEIDNEKEEFIRRKKEELGIEVNEEDNEKKGLFKNIFKELYITFDLQDEFANDLYKKYPKLEVEDYEDIEAMENDFASIIEYDWIIDSFGNYFYSGKSDIKEISKLKIGEKEAYIAKRYHKNMNGTNEEVVRYVSLFMKCNLNKRLHLQTKWTILKTQKETFDGCFYDLKDEMVQYDLRNYDELKKTLSDEFYYQKFSVTSNEELLEIDENIKYKLLELYKKYNQTFLIAIKDNLLRIELRVPNPVFESQYSILYKLEKTMEGLLEIFGELERTNDKVRFNSVANNYHEVKNLIFDLDNTIIFDTEEDSEYYREALENAGFTDDYFYGIYQVIDYYDKAITEDNPYYNEKEMLDFINESLEQDFNMQVIDEMKAVAGREWTKRILISKDVMEYLSSKYNLYVYTNYYQDVQTDRLKVIGYDKYFKKIFGADKYGCKQFKKCFEGVLEEINAKPEECVMIGDDKSRDIVGANNVNMKSILFDYNGRRDKKEIDADNYFIIRNMNELKKLF